MALQTRPSDFDSAELDRNDTNSAAPTTARQDDGYVLGAEPPSNEHNFVFARLWRGIKSLFQKPVEEFATTTFYEQGEWVREGGIVFEAKVAFTSTGSFDVNDWDVAIKSGVETVNGDAGPAVVLTASDFTDINSITENDLRYLRPFNGFPNSDFEIWNEGTVFAAIANETYFAELYLYGNITSAVHQVQRTTDVPTFAESGVNSTFSPEIKVTTTAGVPSANQFTIWQHLFQGFDIKNWLGRNIVISFWVKSTNVGTYCLALRNEAQNRSFVKEYTIDVADTWERKEIPLFFDPTGTWNIVAGQGLVVTWALAIGTDFHAPSDGDWHNGLFFSTANQINFNNFINSTFEMTLPQLDLGLTDPAPRRVFNKLPIDEDAMYIRKFIQIYNNLRYVSQKDGPDAPFEWAFPFPVAMRSAPAVISSNVIFDNAGTLTFNNISGTSLNVGILSVGGISSQAMSVQFDLKLDARF